MSANTLIIVGSYTLHDLGLIVKHMVEDELFNFDDSVVNSEGNESQDSDNVGLDFLVFVPVKGN